MSIDIRRKIYEQVVHILWDLIHKFCIEVKLVLTG